MGTNRVEIKKTETKRMEPDLEVDQYGNGGGGTD